MNAGRNVPKRTPRETPVAAALILLLLLASLAACAAEPVHHFNSYDDLKAYFANANEESALFPDISPYEQRDLDYSAEWWKCTGAAACKKEFPSSYRIEGRWHGEGSDGQLAGLLLRASTIDPRKAPAGTEPSLYLPVIQADAFYRDHGFTVSAHTIPYDQDMRKRDALPAEAVELEGNIRVDAAPYSYAIEGSVALLPDAQGRAAVKAGEATAFPLAAREELLTVLDSILDQAGAPAATEKERAALLHSELWMIEADENEALTASDAAEAKRAEEERERKALEAQKELEEKRLEKDLDPPAAASGEGSAQE